MLDRMLPELLILVLERVSLSDRLQVSLVCRKLHHFFWSVVPCRLRNGLYFNMEYRLDKWRLLLKSKLVQNSAVKELLLHIPQSRLSGAFYFHKWPSLAPQLTTLTLSRLSFSDHNIFRLLEPCSALINLSIEVAYLNIKGSSRHCNLSKLKISLANMKHLNLHLLDSPQQPPDKSDRLTEFLDKLLGCFRQLCSLSLNGLTVQRSEYGAPSLRFDILLRHIRLHVTSFHSLEISGSQIDDEQLLEVASITGLRLTTLDISRCKGVSQEAFIRFCSLQPHLRSLKLDGDHRILSDYTLALQHLFQQGLRELETLSVRQILSPPLELPQLLSRLDSLRELDVIDCECCHAMMAQSLNRSSFKLLKLCAYGQLVAQIQVPILNTLKELVIPQDITTAVDRNHNDMFINIWRHCYNLETLIIDESFVADHQLAVNNLRQLSCLSVSIKSFSEVPDSAMTLLQLPSLRKLTLIVDRLEPDHLEGVLLSLASHTPLLQFLQLYSCSYLFDEGTQRITEKYADYWPRMKNMSIKL